MIIPDVNLLVYAYEDRSQDHLEARQWWESVLYSADMIGIPWAVALGFIRLITNPRMFPNPTPVSTATACVRSWLAQPNVEIIHPGPRHADLVFGLLEEVGVGANLTMDAHLAALAIEHHATLHTTDSDFTRFPGLRWVNPLKRKKR